MELVVGTMAGKVRGFEDAGAMAFLGVPFAAPPFGEHRLRAPQPPTPWDGIRDTIAYGATSQQPDDEIVGGIPEPSIPGDDILTVNVWTPDLGPDARLPVMVWIHGGGFYAGSPASPWYRGGRFARDGVVVVTVGYRLGAEGFLQLDGAPPNRAILDWLAALDWVQQNIASFGGDPGNVTVAGQSAGAAAATMLLSMPKADGLFRRIISMSGVAMAVTPEQAEETARDLLAPLGIAATRDAVAARPFADFHAAQRALQRQDEAGRPNMAAQIGRFVPVVDGELVVEKPIKAIARGVAADRDVLVGATRDEATFGVRRRSHQLDEAGLLAMLEGLSFPAATYRQFHHTMKPAEVLGRAVTDRMFRSRVQSLAEARATAPPPTGPSSTSTSATSSTTGGDGAPSQGRTYAYEFRWHPSPADLRANIGAVHCIDLPFAFDNLDAADVAGLAGPNPPQPLADLMHAAWVGFVTRGDPGWPAHDLAQRQMMLFDVESGPAEDPLKDERVLWRR